MTVKKLTPHRYKKLFLFLKRGGKVAEAARVFNVSRTHIYRLLKLRDGRDTDFNFRHGAENTEPYSNATGLQNREAHICKKCRWLFFFTKESGANPDFCSKICVTQAIGQFSRDPRGAATERLAEASLPKTVFAANELQRRLREKGEGKIIPEVITKNKQQTTTEETPEDNSDLVDFG